MHKIKNLFFYVFFLIFVKQILGLDGSFSIGNDHSTGKDELNPKLTENQVLSILDLSHYFTQNLLFKINNSFTSTTGSEYFDGKENIIAFKFDYFKFKDLIPSIEYKFSTLVDSPDNCYKGNTIKPQIIFQKFDKFKCSIFDEIGSKNYTTKYQNDYKFNNPNISINYIAGNTFLNLEIESYSQTYLEQSEENYHYFKIQPELKYSKNDFLSSLNYSFHQQKYNEEKIILLQIEEDENLQAFYNYNYVQHLIKGEFKKEVKFIEIFFQPEFEIYKYEKTIKDQPSYKRSYLEIETNYDLSDTTSLKILPKLEIKQNLDKIKNPEQNLSPGDADYIFYGIDFGIEYLHPQFDFCIDLEIDRQKYPEVLIDNFNSFIGNLNFNYPITSKLNITLDTQLEQCYYPNGESSYVSWNNFDIENIEKIENQPEDRGNYNCLSCYFSFFTTYNIIDNLALILEYRKELENYSKKNSAMNLSKNILSVKIKYDF